MQIIWKYIYLYITNTIKLLYSIIIVIL